MCILSIYLITGCGGGDGGERIESVPISPVSFTVPLNGAVGVPIGNKLSITFSEAMDSATINTTTFTLKQGTRVIAGTVAYAGLTAVFTPASNFEPSTTYTARITAGVENLAGNSLASDYVWTFTTGAAADTTAPTVTFTVPADGDTGVAINKKITATFSEAVDPFTITGTTFTLMQGATAVPGVVTYVGLIATFTPTGGLAANTTYTATITTGAEDLAGNALASDYVWTFTTGAAPDITAPTVSLTAPADGETGVLTNKKITATFSEAMDPLTISTATFTTLSGATAVSGTVVYSGVTAVFTPDSDLAYDTTYTATITTATEDLAGNALAEDYTWEFITGAAPDTTAPTVTLTDPMNGAGGVALNKKISATFSEAMDPLTLTNVYFTLTDGGTPVPGTVGYSGVTAVFTPDSDLAYDTTYTATITTEAKDLAGNALAEDYTWEFTTGAAPDTTAPTVTLTDPANLETIVALNKKISATFSEAMDPLTLTNVNFTLTDGGTTVPGTVGYSGVTAVFTPATDLAYDTTYTATITTAAEDLAGNALAEDYTWEFTTGAAPDTTAPTVTLTDPMNGAGGVALNKKISATFSEAMDPLTLTNVNFTLTDGVTPVSGTVAYSGVTAVFTPDSYLAYDTTYTATITTAAEDLAGNALAEDYTWEFTTGAAPDTTAPTVTLTDPVNGAGGVALNKKISATFSEAMDPLTLTNVNFTLTDGGTPVSGTVAYSGVTAVFTPDSDLAYNTTYTATITTAAKDLAGNALASDYVWSFTTGAAPDTTAPTVTITDPVDAAIDVILSKKVQATFSEAMDPLTITTDTFTLMDGVTPVSGTVAYVGLVATFTPTSDLAAGTTYTATITTAAEDLAGNALASVYVWTFTTVAAVPQGPLPVDLLTAGNFTILTKTGITTTGGTQITGDIGVSPIAATAMTGFTLILDGSGQFATSINVSGRVYAASYTAPTPAMLTTAISDMETAYGDAAGRTLPDYLNPGTGNISGMTLAPGLYKFTTGVLISSAGVTFSGGPDDVWIIQTPTLNLQADGIVTLIAGAQAKNIFWQVPGAVVIAADSTLQGNLLAATAITVASGAALNGRVLGQTNLTLIGNTITAP